MRRRRGGRSVHPYTSVKLARDENLSLNVHDHGSNRVDTLKFLKLMFAKQAKKIKVSRLAATTFTRTNKMKIYTKITFVHSFFLNC